MEKYYVNYYIASGFFQERKYIEVDSLELDDLEFPQYTFGFELITKEGKKVLNKEIYLIGSKLTMDDVEKIYGKDSSAFRNFKSYLKVDKSCSPFLGAVGNFQMLTADEKSIDPYKLKNFNKDSLGSYNEKLEKIKVKKVR